MKPSNYEVMRDRMRIHFLQYNQDNMIRKFDLQADERFLYIHFFSKDYRIDRNTGVVEGSDDGFCSVFLGDYNESMTIYDVLCCSKDNCCLSGDFMPPNSLKGVVHTSHQDVAKGMFEKHSCFFNEKVDLLSEACRCLGGIPEGKGDVSYRLLVFDFLPMRFEFWKSDEEFPPQIGLLWDRNVLQYMHYETLWFAAGHLMRKLTEIIEGLQADQ